MKKILTKLLILILMLGISGCQSPSDVTLNESSAKVLIAYYDPNSLDLSNATDETKISTQEVARLITKNIDSDLFQIETKQSYPTDYEELYNRVKTEQEENTLPELLKTVDNFEQYETIILGFPNWLNDLPMAIYSFLDEYDFGAKTVIPFVTYENDELESMVSAISNVQPGALVQDNGLSLNQDNVGDLDDVVNDWVETLNLNETGLQPEANGDNTVYTATVDPNKSQSFYLWEEGNVPTTTEYVENRNNYSDDPDFRPTIISYPVAKGTTIKGAVLICAGGAFQFRSNQYEGYPVAKELSQRGYQSFVINYRLRPYTQEEGALDLARAVRFVRYHSSEYGIEENDIAVMGFSAGGILCGEMLLNFDEEVNGTVLDDSYQPDSLDIISANASAAGMIYSFYGRLSVASTDVDKFASSSLPPTYFSYGTRDPFVREFEKCIEALNRAEVKVETNVLNGLPHGYGANGNWIDDYDQWLIEVFE